LVSSSFSSSGCPTAFCLPVDVLVLDYDENDRTCSWGFAIAGFLDGPATPGVLMPVGSSSFYT